MKTSAHPSSFRFPSPVPFIAPPAASNQMTADRGFVATNSPSTSDQVLKWSGDTTAGASGYDSFWFFQNLGLPFWTRLGDATFPNFNLTPGFFPRHRGFFVTSRNVKTSWVVLPPWTP